MVGARTGQLTTGRALFAGAALLVFALDRVTKSQVVAAIPENTERGPYLGFIWIQHIQNSCAAFSLCGPAQSVFLVISGVVLIAIVVYTFRLGGGLLAHGVLGLVLGGVAGNAFDRLLHGSVTDFIGLHWWPTFNVADSAISVGLVVIALGYLSRRPPSA